MNKLCSLGEAISQEIRNGMAVAMGCGRIPAVGAKDLSLPDSLS